MTAAEISEAFTLLRETCDPRGHAVLRALENLCIVEHVALEALVAATEPLVKADPVVVARIEDYSRKV